MEFDDFRSWGDKNYTTGGPGKSFNLKLDEMKTPKRDDINLDVKGYDGPIACWSMKDACTVIESLMQRNFTVVAVPKRTFIDETIYIFYKSDKRSKE